LRTKICNAAVSITKGINYLGAGTVEFILDTDGAFYFLEMNTRLQVEHPITEMVTGLDLVEWQIKIAEGEMISFTQNDLKQNGHAIEVRLYAEDPDNNFLPSVGKIEYIGDLESLDARLDCGYAEGNSVTISFDPMLSKLVVWAENRSLAIEKMLVALDKIYFYGEELQTNRDYLKRILKTQEFFEGKTYTHFVHTYQEKLKKKELSKDILAASIFAYIKSNNIDNETDDLRFFRNI
jgi:3-methylcrotonyl-CoA carboxylase alpha subunit